ncbi:unnamed protein product [Lupinus luteus]|uniref:DUF7780 domain-containing protein n=1 Tax=Lupinus luteus TaxID=3873 RepID=A0AAV1WNM2_LUPLU
MGLLSMAKAKSTSITTTTTTNSNYHSSMGFLLVFFHNNNTKLNFTSPNTKSHTSTLKTPNSNNIILSKTQFTISICALLIFFTLLIFTLSTFEPTISNITPTHHHSFIHKPTTIFFTKSKTHNLFLQKKALKTSHALQKMGTLYRRGTLSMNNVVICHVAEETSERDFRLFLRIIHRFGVTALNDVVFLFSSLTDSVSFGRVIHEENNSFSSLVSRHAELASSELSFNFTRVFSNKSEKVEPLWGKRIQSDFSGIHGGEFVVSYGSVVSFDATELDPENSLGGFLERVPLSLRRWACYPMLLGRVRRNFKRVMLVDVKNTLILKDPFGRVRNRSPESVFLFNKKNSDKNRSTQRRVNSGVIIGGARGVRRLCNAVLVEIVRAAMQHSKQNSVSDSVILSQLVGNEFMWKNNNIVNFVTSTESIPEASSLVGHNSGTATSLLNHAIIQRSSNNHEIISYVINKEICSSVNDSSIYKDC